MSTLDNCDFLILCGGKGTRLHSTLPGVPKLLVQINGKPLIQYLINHLSKFKIKNLILCTGYLHNEIEEWFEKFYSGSLNIKFSKENLPLGTGGAVKNATKHISGKTFFVINGDTYCPLNYKVMLEIFTKSKSKAVMGLIKTTYDERYGAVSLDKNENIIGFIEKEKKIVNKNENFFLNTGCYIFDRAIIKKIKSGNSSLEIDLFPILCNDANFIFKGYVFKEKFIDIGTPESYAFSQRYLKSSS